MDFIKDLYREFQEDDLMGGAAELAYRFLFALFPFFIFLAALSGYVTSWLDVQNPTDEIVSSIGDTLPADASGVLEEQLRGVLDNSRGGLLSFGAIAALWAASSATKTVMKWMNRVYNVREDRPFLKKQAVGLGLTLVGALGFILGAAVLIGGQVAGSEITEQIGLSGAWGTVVSWARIPAALLLLMAAMAVVYWVTPNAGLPFAWITPGAVLFVVTWIVATIAFAFYVANFANYQATYGALGGVIILMLWLYITALVLLLGGKINATIEARRMETTEMQTDAAAIAQRDLDPEVAHERRVRPGDPALAPGAYASRSETERERARRAERTSGEAAPRGHADASRGTRLLGAAVLGAVAVQSLRRVFGAGGAGDRGGGGERRQAS
ncbi:MAG: YihY/virulence factor BrkB family protein [Dehalococcoidia bacterium]